MKPSILLCLISISFLSGCSSARYVMKDQSQGVIAMAGPSDGNWEKARELMHQHFPTGYTVVKEEEVPVGVATHVHKHESGNKSIVTRDKTEYRIHYVSNSSSAEEFASADDRRVPIQTVSAKSSTANSQAGSSDRLTTPTW